MTLRYLILGLLTERPMSGYDIRKSISGSMGLIANVSYGSLYPALHRLLEDGAVTVEVELQDGRPPRKVYSITDDGRQEFERWLRQPAGADQVRREFLLKLWLGKTLAPEELTNLVEHRRREVESNMARLNEMRNQVGDKAVTYTWVLDYFAEMYQAELRWLSSLKERLEER